MFTDYFHRQLLMRRYLMADETRVQVLNEPERNPETDSWMWLFRSGEDELPPILLYHYTETRARFDAAFFLQGFSGYLETDGYQGYEQSAGYQTMLLLGTCETLLHRCHTERERV